MGLLLTFENMTFLLMVMKNPLGDIKENDGEKAESGRIVLIIGEFRKGVELGSTNDLFLDHIRTMNIGAHFAIKLHWVLVGILNFLFCWSCALKL